MCLFIKLLILFKLKLLKKTSMTKITNISIVNKINLIFFVLKMIKIEPIKMGNSTRKNELIIKKEMHEKMIKILNNKTLSFNHDIFVFCL